MPRKTPSKNPKCKNALRLNNAIYQFAKDIGEYHGLDLPICKKKRKPRQLLTTEQAAKSIGRKKHTLENWRSIGVGPVFHKVGGRIHYKRVDLLSYLEDRKFDSTSAYFASPMKLEVK